MKNTKLKITFLTIIILPCIIYAQDYNSFPEENAFWTVAGYELNTYIFDVSMYTIKGDTTVSDKQYKKIYRLTETSNNDDTLWTLHCLMRQDIENKKVYFIRTYQGELNEKLGYDFDVNVGDTISLQAFDYANIGDSLFVLEYIDSTFSFNGELLIIYVFASVLQYGSFGLQIIEGIGEYKSPCPNQFFWDPFHQSEMTCLIVDGIYIYGMTSVPSENCGFDILDISLVELESVFIISPNPVKSKITIGLNRIYQYISDVVIYNSLGTIVYSKSINELINGDLAIDVSTYPNGIYYLILNVENNLIFTEKIIINH